MTVNAGAGGTDAQDWAEMVLRMMMRWAERRGFKVELLEASAGEEAGIKSATFRASGENAYGLYSAEKGVHRLVRLSPFDAANRRQTSFAGVEVAPVVEDADVSIEDDDLQIDTYRASGAGGQHVNKTDSAVRITHRPTGVVVQCQNERSQSANKATAMAMLRSKLVERAERERQAEIARERGEAQDVNFGSQIRSYVLHPYTMVKDHRTDFEVGSAERVLDGDLDGFVRAWLEANAKASPTRRGPAPGAGRLVLALHLAGRARRDRALRRVPGLGAGGRRACIPAACGSRRSSTRRRPTTAACGSAARSRARPSTCAWTCRAAAACTPTCATRSAGRGRGTAPARPSWLPGFHQYWRPLVLRARAEGFVEAAGERWSLDGATAYVERNWGDGFPPVWWWGEAHDFGGDPVTVAFAGGPAIGPLHATAVVVHVGGRLVRLGEPVLAGVREDIAPGRWVLRGRSLRHRVEIEAAGRPGGRAHPRRPGPGRAPHAAVVAPAPRRPPARPRHPPRPADVRGRERARRARAGPGAVGSPNRGRDRPLAPQVDLSYPGRPMDHETLDLIDRALAEDVGAGDATTEATVDAAARARATITQKAPGVISGLAVAEAVFRRLDPDAAIEPLGPEGEWRDAGAGVLRGGRARRGRC